MEAIFGISVIICCYNSGERIESALKSVISQNNIENINIELILVDNNSCDDTVQRVKNMERL